MISNFTHPTPLTPPCRDFFFVRACMRGFCSRARSDPQQNEEFLGAERTHRRWWEHTAGVRTCAHGVHVHTTRRVVSRAAERSGECATKKRNHAPCGCTHMHMHTLTHVRAGECAHMCVPESAHTCTCTYAPAGCMKSTHPKRNDRSKARSRKT